MNAEIPILFQSAETVAVNKPVGISIHNAEDTENLLEVLERQLGVRKLFPIHRLDKETSGVQIFAFDEASARKYAEQFQTRLVRKIYVGILRGSLKGADHGIWSTPLTDKSEGRVNPAGVVKDRVTCETRYLITRRSKFFTECEFELITGRQHQIRKHSALAGHALVGDARYGDRKYNERMAGLYQSDRMFLHCASIELNGQSFTAPIPKSFASLFSSAN